MLSKEALSDAIKAKVAENPSDTWGAISEAIVETLKNTLEVSEDLLPHTHPEFKRVASSLGISSATEITSFVQPIIVDGKLLIQYNDAEASMDFIIR